MASAHPSPESGDDPLRSGDAAPPRTTTGTQRFMSKLFTSAFSIDLEQPPQPTPSSQVDSVSNLVPTPLAEEDEEVKDSEEGEDKPVCSFHIKGTCRFGSRCRNLHPPSLAPALTLSTSPTSTKKRTGDKALDNRSPKDRSPASSDESQSCENGAAKMSLKTAADVIKRIRWDEPLREAADKFTVGYVDRFLGVVERPFLDFNWEDDIASVDNDTLVVPQHRIKYFKYKHFKVWDRDSRIDHVFGSGLSASLSRSPTGRKSITQLMAEVDEQAAAPRGGRRPLVSQGVSIDVIQDDSDLSSDEEDESDDDSVGLCEPVITSVGDRMHNDERSTHFLAIQIRTPAIKEKAIEIQRAITTFDETLDPCKMKETLFHVTLTMLRLEGPFAAQEAARAVQSIVPEINRYLRNGQPLLIKGLGTFGNRVVYGRVVPDDSFWNVVLRLREVLDLPGIGIKLTNQFDMIPHMTLLKVSRPVTKLRHSKYVDPASYIKFQEAEFGRQPFDNLNLCVIEDTTRLEDGFYCTLKDWKLGPSAENLE